MASRAEELVAAEQRRDARVIDLARALSIAVQIEPELIRAMRLRLVPIPDAAVEADLWFSPLVQNRDPDGISFLADVAELLRRELSDSSHERARRIAWDVVSSMHARHSPMLVLEETATYLSVASEPNAYLLMERELGRALAALEASTDDLIARWVARMLPRLPEIVRHSDPALALARRAGRKLGGVKIRGVLDAGSADEEWTPTLLASLPKVAVGLELTTNGLELGLPPLADRITIDVPHTNPLVLVVATPSEEGWAARRVMWPAGSTTTADVTPGPALRVETIAGDTLTLRVGTLERRPVVYVAGAGEAAATVVREARDLCWSAVTRIEDLQFHDDAIALDAVVLGHRTGDQDLYDGARGLDVLLDTTSPRFVTTTLGFERIREQDIEGYRYGRTADPGITAVLRGLTAIEPAQWIVDLRRVLINLDVERARHWVERFAAPTSAARRAPFVDAPYPGLRPFAEHDAPVFYGRAVQVDQLLALLAETHCAIVVGASGSGKASLLGAGVIARLHAGFAGAAGPRWRVVVLRPGTDPLHNLATALAKSLAGESASESKPSADELRNLLVNKGLSGLFDRASLPAGTNLLFVVNQLEEIVGSVQPRDAATLIELLIAVTERTDQPIYTVLTLDLDFLSQVRQVARPQNRFEASMFRVPPFSAEDLRNAIVKPAALAGRTIEAAAVDAIVSDAIERRNGLALMQFALHQLWTLARGKSSAEPAITLADYEAISRLDALARMADGAFAALDEEGQRIAELTFRRLTERVARRPTRLSELAAVAETTHDRLAAVVDNFRSEHRPLLAPPHEVPLIGTTVIDLAHEFVIREWDRLLEWSRKESQSAEFYNRLNAAATSWMRGERPLWTGEERKRALEWRAVERPNAVWAMRYGGQFDAATQFLDAMQRGSGTPPRARSGAPVIQYAYYVSFANADVDDSLQRFLDLLRNEVKFRTDLEPAETAFIDRSAIRAGEPWPERLMRRLERSAVLTCICSPHYFASDLTGREVEYFMRRHPGPLGNLLPVVWIPVSTMPRPLSDMQLLSSSMPDIYRKEGARYLVETHAEGDLSQAVAAVAHGIVRMAESLRGRTDAITDVPNLADLPSAWRGRAPTVRFFIVAASLQEMTSTRKSLEAYGGTGLDWRPFFPPRTETIAVLAQRIAAEANFLSKVMPIQSDWQEQLDEARASNQIAVVLIDGWSVPLESSRRLIQVLERRADRHVVTIVLLNNVDAETAQERHWLEQNIQEAFGARPRLLVDPIFRRPGSSDEFATALRDALEEARRRIVIESPTDRFPDLPSAPI